MHRDGALAGPSAAIRRGRAGLRETTALSAVAFSLIALPAAAQPVPSARPQGGAVVAGAASISQSPSTTTITQTSNRAAIDWQGFDVGSNQAVDFRQPSAAAMTLNRVVGPDPSAIAGRIDANGGVVIINQSGVVFYQGAQVNAANLVVSAPNMSNRDFMAGRLALTQPANPGAVIDNRGTITVKQAGLAALVAPAVRNSGTINAHFGHVVLAGAEAATLDLYGDGLVALDVTKSVATLPTENGRPVSALVTNTGAIVADGGTVQISAAGVDGLVQNFVAAGGTIQAASLPGHPGNVVIDATGGAISIDGAVLASAAAPGANGGNITIGSAAATRSSLAASGHIAADAIAGNGGSISLMSSAETVLAGRITARGGTQSGNGGHVEISSLGSVVLAGNINVSARAAGGTEGDVLIDPATLTIGTGAGQTPWSSFTNGVTGDLTIAAGSSLTVNQSVFLSGTNPNLTLTAGGTLAVNIGISINVPGNLTLSTTHANSQIAISDLASLTAGGNIALGTAAPASGSPSDAIFLGNSAALNGQNIAFTTDRLNLAGSSATRLTVLNDLSFAPAQAGREVQLYASGVPDANALAVPANGSLQFSAGTLTLGSANAGPIKIGTAGDSVDLTGAVSSVSATVLHLVSAGTVSEPAAALNVTTLTGQAGGFNLSSNNNQIGTIGSLNAGGGSIAVTDARAMTINGPLTGGVVTLIADANVVAAPGGDLTLAGNINATNLTLETAPGFNITQTAGVITANTLTGSTTAAALDQANQVGTITGFATENGFSFNDNRPLTVTGTIFEGSSNITISVIGSLTIAAGATIDAANEITLSATGTISEGAGASIVTPVLTGTAGAATLDSSANNVNALLGFTTTAGDFRFTDAPSFAFNGNTFSLPLTVEGTLSVPTGHTIALTADAMTLAGEVPASLLAPGGAVVLTPLTAGNPVNIVAAGTASATGLSLNASDLGTIRTATLQLGSASAGPITIGSLGTDHFDFSAIAGTLDLVSAGAVSVPASLTLGTLAGSTGAASLANFANAIGTLGPYASTGSFTLNDAVPLAIAGAVGTGTGQNLAINDDAIRFAAGGALAAPNAAASLAPLVPSDAFTLAGGAGVNGASLVSARTLQIGVPAGGPISVAGALNFAGAGTVDLESGGAVSETAGAGIGAATLTGNVGTLALNGRNAIATLGRFDALGNLSLADSGALTIAGPVTAGTAAIATTGNLTVTGQVAATNVALSGADIIENGGLLLASGTLSLAATGTINQIGGQISAGTLIGEAQSAILDGADNGIAVLGGFIASGTLSLADTGSLTLRGPVNAGSLAIGAFGSLAIAGPLTAGAANLTAASIDETGNGQITAGSLAATSAAGMTLGGANAIAALGDVTAPNGLVLNNAGPLAITGSVTASNVVLTDSGAISEPGGAITTTQLSGDAAGATLTGGNVIATLDNFRTGGAIALADSESLTLAGNIAASALQLAVNGSVIQSGGVLTLGALSGSAVGLAQFGPDAPGPVANITTLGPFPVRNGNLVLTDSVPLTITGALSAADFAITAPGITLANAAISTTGLPFASQSGTTPALPGSFFRVTGNGRFSETGTSTLTPLTGTTATLRIDTSQNNGAISLADLVGPQANLILASGGGRISGLIDVGGLLVLGTGGDANLLGSVAGAGGFAAAALGQIAPRVDPAYTLNGCPIATTDCLVINATILVPYLVPYPIPLSILHPELLTLPIPSLSLAPNPNDPEIELPNVSGRDY